MRIFSNFDTQFRKKVYNKRREKYGEEQVLVIRRSKYHLIFRVIIPIIILLVLAVVGYIFLGKNAWMHLAVYPLGFVWFLVLWFRPIHKLLKYLYDFTIIDPSGVTTYKQKWIFKSYLKQIPGNRIRSIEIERNSLLENVFWYGCVNILTDFMENMHLWEDEESPSVIGMTYVDQPYKVKNQITDICFY